MSDSLQEAQRIIFVYFGPVLIAVCLIGNLFTFVIYSRKSFRKWPFSLYMRALNISDSFGAILFLRLVYRIGYGIELNITHQFFCTFSYYSICSVTVMSAYLLCIFSFDRTATIVFANKFGFLKKRWFQIGAIVTIVVYALIAYIGIPIMSQLYTNKKIRNVTFTFIDKRGNRTTRSRILIEESLECVFLKSSSDVIGAFYYYFDLANAVIVPFTLMITFTVISILRIYKSRANSSSSSSPPNKFKLKRKEVNFAIVSITANLSFLILSTPVTLAPILPIGDPLLSNIYDTIGRFLFYSNFGSMFFVNIITNKLFKRELIGIFRPQQLQSTITTTQLN
jgi:hypothetical protein